MVFAISAVAGAVTNKVSEILLNQLDSFVIFLNFSLNCVIANFVCDNAVDRLVHIRSQGSPLE